MTRPASYQGQIPAAVYDYITRYGWAEHPRIAGGPAHPIIHQTFTPGRGWTRYPFRKRITRSWARRHLRPSGVTHVAVTDGARVADFRIEELT
jgi:hypothetical protein